MTATTLLARACRRLALALVLLIVWLHAGAADASPRLVIAAHSGRVTVLAEPGLERAAAQLAGSAETTLARIAADLDGLPVPLHIEVRLVSDAADLAGIAPEGRGAPAWAIGVAYPDLGVISVAMHRGSNWEDPGTTLRHELAHVALGAAIGPRAPHWLHEGFAYQHSAEWNAERVETLAGMAWLGSIIPLEDLDRSFPAAESPAHRAYAESYDFVGFLSRRGRFDDVSDDGDRWPFRRFLSAIGHGADPDTAAVEAYGRPLHLLFEEWRSDLKERYRLVPIGLLGLALWVMCGILVVLAHRRRRRQARARFAQWDRDEAAVIAVRLAEAQARARAAAEAAAVVDADPAGPIGPVR